MKTSELRQGIKNLGFDFKETDEYILVDHVIRIFKIAQRFNVSNYGIYGYKKIMLLKLAIEYTETPIEDREEEKKYCFKLYDGFEKTIPNKFLKLDVSDGLFYFNEQCENIGRFKGTFTEKIINNFPSEIKGAIECGFLVKVEVGK